MVRRMSRALLVMALGAGVASAPPLAAAKKPAVPKAIKASKHAHGHTSAKAKSTKKKKKAPEKTVSRIPSKATLAHTENMPHGYAWPPSAQMMAAEKVCESELDVLGVAHKPAAREGRIADAMIVSDDAGMMTLGGIEYVPSWRQGPQKIDCQLALTLQRFGHELYDLGVRRVKYGSIYRWTNVRVNGKTRPFLSRHALGIAMDIVSFIDDAGREANVKKDYPAGDPLLLGIETTVNASGKFRLLLTPKNDPISHSDHFHLEVAVDYTATEPAPPESAAVAPAAAASVP